MSAPLRKGSFAELITPVLRSSFYEGMEERAKQSKRTMLYGDGTLTRHKETTVGIGNMSTSNFRFKGIGRTQYSGLEQGFAKDWIAEKFKGGIQVDRDLIEDLLDDSAPIPRSLTENPRAVGDALEIFCEQVAAEPFNYAFTDSGTTPNGFGIAGPDGVGLCSTAHPLSPTNATTQSNEYTLDLTVDNLDTVMVGMAGITDDQGNKIGIVGDTLVVPYALRRRGLTIVQSELEPGHANNDANVVGNGIQNVIVWPYLTDSNAWFVVDSTRMKRHLLWLNRTTPQWAGDLDEDTDTYRWSVRYRFDRGFDDWKWIAGSNPS
jgi:hypothetical protein